MRVTQTSWSCRVDPDRRRKKLCYIRTVSLALALILIVTSFTQPVSAETVNGMLVTDLLDTGSIMFGTEKGAYTNEYIGVDYFSGSKQFYFNWEPPSVSSRIQYVYVTVYAASQPLTVYLFPYSGATHIAGTLIGSYNGYYQYRFPITVSTDDLTLWVRWGSATPGYFGIISAQAYSNVYEPISKINFYQYSSYIDPDVSLLYREAYASVANAVLPYASTHVQSPSETDEFKFDDYYIDVPTANNSLNSYDSITFVLDYCGIFSSSGVTLYAPGAEVPNVILPDERLSTQSFTVMPDSSGITNDFPIYTISVTVDLSGYDLEYYTIDLDLSLEPVSGSANTNKFTYLNVRSIYMNQEIHEEKWYQTFWSWLSGGLEGMTSTINGKIDDLWDGMTSAFSSQTSSLLSGITTQTNAINSKIDSFWSAVTSAISTQTSELKSKIDTVISTVKTELVALGDRVAGLFLTLFENLDFLFDNLFNKLDYYLADKSNGSLGQAGSEMSDQADEMDQAQEKLDAVERPALDANAMLDTYLTFDPGGLSILSALTSNSQVTAMLTVVFTFSLCGYIFFGKKA